MGTYDRVETDNPLLDELVYSAKLLMASTILKNEDKANESETKDSRRDFQIYERILLNLDTFYHYSYTKEDLIRVNPLISDSELSKCLTNINNIQEPTRTLLTQMKNKEFLENHLTPDGRYIDSNSYYRNLTGLPASEKAFVYLTEGQYRKLNMKFDYKHIPVHLLPVSIRKAIVNSGIIDEIICDYPVLKYLSNIDKELSAYTMRKAFDHSLIYANSSNVNAKVASQYVLHVEKNRDFIIATADIESLKLYSDYTNQLLDMMIIIQSVIDLISDFPNYYISQDLFDYRTIKDYIESKGVPFFNDIPLEYQIRIVKSLNALIKNKATDEDFINILAIFNISNINIYKYYLCRYRNIDDSGNYMNTGNLEEDYNLSFLKTNVTDSPKIAAKDAMNYESYDHIISTDKSWNGPYPKDEVKMELLKRDFNIELSKYISIDAIYSMNEVCFEMTYFMNMLKFSKISSMDLNVSLNSITSNRNFNLVNVIYMICAVSAHYYGVEDKIIYNQSTCLAIQGFNFEANLQKIADDMNAKGYTLEELGVANFNLATGAAYTVDDIVKIYINNKNIYDHLIYEMENAKNKQMYDIYNYLYESLMITNLNFEHFKINGNKYADTFTEYLKYNDEYLYDLILKFDDYDSEEDRQKAISEFLSDLSGEIITMLHTDELSQIFNNLPSDAGNYIKNFITHLVGVFKAYTVHMLEFRNVFRLDKNNKVKIVDWLQFICFHHCPDSIDIKDTQYHIDSLQNQDSYTMSTEHTYTSFFWRNDKMSYNDKFTYIHTLFFKDDVFNVNEYLKFIRWYFRNYSDSMLMNDYMAATIIHYMKQDRFMINESLDWEYFSE